MNAIVMQCGGPTAVVNASLAGVIQTCREHPAIGQLWGARYGLRGFARGDWVELTDYEHTGPYPLPLQPGAMLGGGRDQLKDSDLPRVVELLHQHAICAVFIIGGNGSMAAAHKLHAYAMRSGYACNQQSLRVIGIPKTIDNDLEGTDFAPGYGSAARFVAQTVCDVGLDLVAMRGFDDVAVLEVMGRHTGWLAAASALARYEEGSPPHLILLPEVALDEMQLLATIRDVHARYRVCLIVAAEGVRDQSGAFLAEKDQRAQYDASGQKLLSLSVGVAPYLANLIRQQLGLRCRQMRPDTLQRSSSTLVSVPDRECATRVGVDAVHAAIHGRSDVMMGLQRDGMVWRTVPMPLDEVANQTRTLSDNFIASHLFAVTKAFLEYARPIMGL
ncbi:MAG: diphosphate--fructose-6-phosphate 1-phosphotransferase [Chloroflexi bacterium AL-W]|nr:diphosphate--fructose-6-phosphate 1-phosphotransferase [Chloroflexi bacterium AL-N1]NOK65228.1 diphosphate--fructose-6-phosphate 1-phosphotransferase [Chloroflexi bacterium AL-N10]NOK72507.1 diphosphate--fructose-6-phosphate 1-phosphotransferase [Chloroflexi bacterium AL-N5]NOK79407.1 diphosphate--fructose-6-phosphate 1-phosphotransferase [Chloroflexi bacterium AL-W]NOK87323.1 diphosphate--fructose-6-phosphate 1-phosphotransferase [Chloroflexi bacterium AL-N15]